MKKSYDEVVQELADLDVQYLRLHRELRRRNEILEEYKKALLYIGSLRCKTIEDAGHAANSVLLKIEMENDRS